MKFSARTYQNYMFLRLVEEGKLTPPELSPGLFHLHWILVRGRPRWVVSSRKTDACDTVRCKQYVKVFDA